MRFLEATLNRWGTEWRILDKRPDDHSHHTFERQQRIGFPRKWLIVSTEMLSASLAETV
jgi:hypothetical protein